MSVAAICAHPERFETPPFRIADRLWYVGNRAVCMHLLDTGDGLILLDAGHPQTVGLLQASIQTLGFQPGDIRWIVCTHAHYDHIGGVQAMAALTGARVAIGRDDVPIAAGRPELTEAGLHGLDFHETFAADRALDDGETLTLGDTAILCRHTPGHTPGTMSYFFDVTIAGTPFRAGLHGGPGLASLSDAYLAAHGLPAGLRADYWRALQRLRREPVAIHLSTHPPQCRLFERRDRAAAGDPLAFVDELAWPAYLESLEAAFRRRFGDETIPMES